MKKVNGHEIINLFEEWSPKKYAMEGDPVGLHIGALNRTVEKVLITLDVNEAVVDEAIEIGATLIIAHHPPIFRPLKGLFVDTPQGRMIEKCIKNNLSVYAAHTNLDVATGGVNDMLANLLELQDTDVVEVTYSESLYKLSVFSPVSHADALRQALAGAGAGAIGDYKGCSFTSSGTGRFTPSEGANPFIGSVDEMESVAEEKIEVVLPEHLKQRVLKAMVKAHPYEEPAYDYIRLDQQTNELGLGRIGKLKEELTLEKFAGHVKSVFNVPAVRFVGDPTAIIRKVAVLGGDGNKYIHAAKRKGADVLVTGDLYYHIAHDAEAIGLNIVDPGHNIEKVMIQGVAKYMTQACLTAKYNVEFYESKIITEPFQFI
ncbi:Nif3-like dinuclear metal center hexameric protein [Sporosarcina siberiensis]|uniref:GTP cyclohydrolase 1 type 2 homolog n=1 Tax=Sporosarcina siberiensis TaxID=1365606 RepID=A0ABW4SAP9_9BACL